MTTGALAYITVFSGFMWVLLAAVRALVTQKLSHKGSLVLCLIGLTSVISMLTGVGVAMIIERYNGEISWIGQMTMVRSLIEFVLFYVIIRTGFSE